jgi:AcrR family transcriptional regulator
MTRASAESRLEQIARAGARRFAHLGYRRTLMAEVAKAAGLSTGAVYSYVESKEALLHLVLASGLGLPAADPTDLPLRAPDIAVTVEMVGRGLTRLGMTPLLKAAAAIDAPQDIRAELAAVVAEQYSTVERLRGVLSVIEACAADLPPLEALYFGRRRRGRIDLLSDYLQRRTASGHLRSLPDMAVAAQIVTETVAWFAWKRQESRDASRFDDDVARATVVEFICNALLPGEAVT